MKTALLFLLLASDPGHGAQPPPVQPTPPPKAPVLFDLFKLGGEVTVIRMVDLMTGTLCYIGPTGMACLPFDVGEPSSPKLPDYRGPPGEDL